MPYGIDRHCVRHSFLPFWCNVEKEAGRISSYARLDNIFILTLSDKRSQIDNNQSMCLCDSTALEGQQPPTRPKKTKHCMFPKDEMFVI